jgi:anaerobic ribonucleoside-triphosphate reductase activating protein
MARQKANIEYRITRAEPRKRIAGAHEIGAGRSPARPGEPQIRNNSVVRVAAFEPRSLANGPGIRAVLWVQGCGRRCPGCFNPDFLSLQGGKPADANEVANWMVQAIHESPDSIEGITFSGGEPFDQAAPLAQIAGKIKALGLGVIIFTGYTWKELQSSRDEGWRELARASDLLVAGPYREGNPGHHPLLSSANQEFVFLTERYREAVLSEKRRKSEFRIGADGSARSIGFPAGIK